MAQRTKKRLGKAEVERRAARVERHRRCARAYRVAVKKGFTGPDHGPGAWKAIRAFCAENDISYPARRSA